MSGVCGWMGVAPGDPRAALDEMAAGLGDAGALRVSIAAAASLGVRGDGRTAWLQETKDFLVGLVGHARWEHETARLASPAGVCDRLIDGYRDRGPATLESLKGDFALALLDRRRGEVLLAVDRACIRNLTYQATRGGLLFGSTLDALAGHPDARRDLDPQAIYEYVYFHMIPGPDTVFLGQRRIPAGHYVHFARGEARVEPYWSIAYEEDGQGDVQDYKSSFISVLREATNEAVDGTRAGAFLSGGTDSSTVTGMIGAMTGQAPRSFSIGFDAQGYDEMEYARIAARHFRADHHEYYVAPSDVVDAIPRIAAAYDQPFGNASAVPTYYCARLATEHGVERLLGGDGGDELFGGNSRYAKQEVLARYAMIPAAVRSHFIEPLLRPASLSRVPIVRKAKSYVNQARLPMPERYESQNLLEHLGAERVFTPNFLAGIDQKRPHALIRAPYEVARAEALINQMLAIDAKFTLADSDLPKVTRMCALAGIDVAFPLLDDRVVSFAACLPPQLKVKGTRLRYFFKEALRDFLPPEVIVKRKHGFGLPVGPWLESHRPFAELVRVSCDGLRERGIVRGDFLDWLWHQGIAAHPAYYGAMAWVLMMLGQWFEDRRA
jgi:asparagine synthase (glutamine-hydrolysing)